LRNLAEGVERCLRQLALGSAAVKSSRQLTPVPVWPLYFLVPKSQVLQPGGHHDRTADLEPGTGRGDLPPRVDQGTSGTGWRSRRLFDSRAA
jgi:hypothetical protein